VNQFAFGIAQRFHAGTAVNEFEQPWAEIDERVCAIMREGVDVSDIELARILGGDTRTRQP
jgi:hypothetical protein